MGLGRLASPAGGPQEALACGLALGRPASAAVRWADRLREKEAFPMWPAITPPTHTHIHTHLAHHFPPHRCLGFGEQQAVQ